jgi:pblA|nr:MAG TPA: Minor tail protein [Caudoviricetes sp.]
MGEIFRLFGTIGIRGSDAEKELDSVAQKGEQTSNKLSSFFKKAATVIAGVFAAGKLIDFGKMSIEAAASAKATQAQFEQVFDGIVDTAENALNSVAKEVGAVPTRIKPAFNQIASFAKVAGMDTTQAMEFTSRATRAAADTAAFYDKSLEETTETLKSYLKGNFQVADNLGILSTETTRNAKATELFGKEYSKLSGLQQQEVLLQMYEDANKVSGAMGQAARESDGWENVMGNLKQTWEDFKATIGSVALDALVVAMQNLTGFVGELKDRFLQLKDSGEQFIKGVVESDAFAKVQEIFSRVVENLKLAFDNIGGVIGGVASIIGSFVDDLLKIATAEDTINAVGGAFEGITGAISTVTDWIKQFVDWINQTPAAVDSVKAVLAGLAAGFIALKVINTVKSAIDGFKAGLAAAKAGMVAFNAIVSANQFTAWIVGITAVVAALTWFFTQTETGKAIWKGFTEWLSSTWTSISSFLIDTWNNIAQTATAIWEGIVSVATAIWSAVTGAIMAVVQPFIDAFMGLWNGMSAGISQMFDGYVTYFTGAWELIKSVFLGAILIIIDLVTLNFGQLGTDLGAIWDGISNGMSMMWEGIKSIFSGAVSAIVGGVQATFNGMASFLSGLWDAISGAAIAGWNGLVAGVQGIIDGLVSGAQAAWDAMSNAVSSLVSGITGIFDGLWHIDLAGAGQAIMDGFLGGLKAAWGAVTDFIGGVANWIRDHKGPIEYDRKLLVPAGNAIMEGFGAGLKDGFSDVQDTVKGIAEEVNNIVDKYLDNEFHSELDFNSNVTTVGGKVIPQIPVDYSVSYGTSLSNVQDASENATVQPIGHASKLDVVIELLLKILEKDNNTYLDGRKLTDVVNGYNKINDRRMMRARGELT